MKKTIIFLSISVISLCAPKQSYTDGSAYALRDYFSTKNKEIITTSKIMKLEDKIYAQKIKYKTFSSFGKPQIKEKIFIIKDINSVYTFVEKIEDLNIIDIAYN